MDYIAASRILNCNTLHPSGLGSGLLLIVLCKEIDMSYCYFSSGMAMAWTSSSFLKVEKKEVDLEMSGVEMGLVAAIPFCGRLFSPIPMGYVMDCIGRRGCLIIGRLIQIVHWVLLYFFHNIWVIYLARLLSGWYAGMAVFVISVYIGETTDKKVRGRTQAVLNIHFLLGTVFETTIGPLLSYDNLIIVSAVVDLFTMIFMFTIPETPYYYIQKDKNEKAVEYLKWLQGEEDVTKDFNRIEKYVKRQMSQENSYGFIFKNRAARKAFIICQILLLLQRCSGVTAIIPYASYVTPDTPWLPNDKGPIALNLTYLLSCGISSIFIDKWGRKKFLFFSSIGTFIFMVGCTVWLYLSAKDYDIAGTEWVAIVCLIGQAVFYSTGYFYIPSLIMSEMFPMNIKAKANALGAMTSTLVSMAIVFMFLPVSNAYGMYINFIIYSVTALIGIFYSLVIIETRGRSLEAIQALLEGRIPSDSSVLIVDPNHER